MVGTLHISSNYSLTLAINVTRLDAVPPGAQPTSINPIDNWGFNWNSLLKRKADKGIMLYWATNPIRVIVEDSK